MKRGRLLLLLAVSAAFCVPVSFMAQADKTAKTFKERLFDRYDQSIVVAVRPNILVAAGGSRAFYPANLDHFYQSLEIPKKYQEYERLDERTYQTAWGTTAAANRGLGPIMDRLQPGDRLKIHKFHVYSDNVVIVAYSLSPTRRALPVGDEGVSYFGLRLLFKFPKPVLANGDYDAVIADINQFILPENEYAERTQAVDVVQQASMEAKKNVEIQPGMTKEEVIKSLGEPLKTIVFGNKTILKYSDLTIELVDNKVVEVKAN